MNYHPTTLLFTLRFRLGLMLTLLATCAAAAGCGQAGARDLTLDPELARQSLTDCLESWKSGQSPDTLQTGSPAIYAGDHEWQSGMRLVSYRVLPEEFNDGANLHVAVELKLLPTAKGRRKPKAVKVPAKYIVGTSPVITISRQ